MRTLKFLFGFYFKVRTLLFLSIEYPVKIVNTLIKLKILLIEAPPPQKNKNNKEEIYKYI